MLSSIYIKQLGISADCLHRGGSHWHSSAFLVGRTTWDKKIKGKYKIVFVQLVSLMNPPASTPRDPESNARKMGKALMDT